MSAIKKNDNDQFDQAIGFRLKMLRQSCRMSQTELGEMLGTSYQQIQRLEAVINRMSPEKLFACAKIFKVPVSYFYDTETHDEINKFDKRVITIDIAIASLPNPDIAQQIYRLAMTIGTDDK